MTNINAQFITNSRTAFLSKDLLTLADIKARVEVGDEAFTVRRDMISALNRVEQLFERPLMSVIAAPKSIRDLFSDKPSAMLGVTDKTLANIRSNVSRALKNHGDPIPQLTKRITPNDDWQILLNTVKTNQWRQGLYRLACFCTVMGIAPDKVDNEVLIGLHEALEAEEIVKRPRILLKNTITTWNRCGRLIENWPATCLSSPYKKQPWTLPLDAFPDSFRADIEAWKSKVTDVDPLNFDGPSRPLKPITVECRIREFRMFGSALIHRNVLTVDEITNLSILMSPKNFKEMLRFFLERQDNATTARLHNLANSMRHIARHHVKIDEKTHTELLHMCKRLNPGNKKQMTQKNRERLRQFDNEKNVIHFLSVSEKLAKEARLRLPTHPLKAARLMERAVMFGIQTHYALRLRTLRSLNLGRNFIWNKSEKSLRCFLDLFPDDLKASKNHLEFELASDLVSLLDEHLRLFRMHLPWSDSVWLFPGQNGQPRSKNAIYEAVRSVAAKHAGLVINPHLFRHALAKIVIERDPGAVSAIQQVLGHSTMDTTLAHYLGTETKSAGIHLDKLLERTLNNQGEV